MQMTPAEQLILRKLLSYVEDGGPATAVSATASELGLATKRVLRVWVMHRLDQKGYFHREPSRA